MNDNSSRIIISTKKIEPENEVNFHKDEKFELDRNVNSIIGVRQMTKEEISYFKCPTYFDGIMIDFGLYNKFKIVMSTSESTSWIELLLQCMDENKRSTKTPFIKSVKNLLLGKFIKKTSTIDPDKDVEDIPEVKSEQNIFNVYQIMTEPSLGDKFNDISHSLIEFNPNFIKLKYLKAIDKPQFITLDYDQIRRYGVSSNIFCMEVLQKSNLNGKSSHHSQDLLCYYLKVDQPENLKNIFEKYTLHQSQNEKIDDQLLNQQPEQIITESQNHIPNINNNNDVFSEDEAIIDHCELKPNTESYSEDVSYIEEDIDKSPSTHTEHNEPQQHKNFIPKRANTTIEKSGNYENTEKEQTTYSSPVEEIYNKTSPDNQIEKPEIYSQTTRENNRKKSHTSVKEILLYYESLNNKTTSFDEEKYLKEKKKFSKSHRQNAKKEETFINDNIPQNIPSNILIDEQN